MPEAAIEYPKESEAIASSTYTFKIGAAAQAERVEISIDGGPWRACRESVGFWWHDWSGYAAGPHEAAARITKKDGSISTSERRLFSVAAV